jgi:predicted RNA binding protein YcfA (HicA-like mRNA interferase family)
MSKLPLVSGRDTIKALTRTGYYVRDQKGSHVHLRHPSKPPLTVPNHDIIKKGTLNAILKAANITIDEFRELL